MPRPTSREKSPIAEAVKELRRSFGETQQQFATRMGVAITTIARYETSHPPKGEVLEKLAEMARANGLNDLSRTFDNARVEDFSLFVRANNGVELAWCLALLECLRNSKYEQVRTNVRIAMEPVLLDMNQKDVASDLRIGTFDSSKYRTVEMKEHSERHNHPKGSKKR